MYDKVAVKALTAAEVAGGNGFAVLLDGRELRTPAKRILALPTHALATGVALEWEAQDRHIRPDTMPLMKLSTTVLDQPPDIRPTMTDSMLRCVASDLACFRSSEEPALMAKEEAAFAPLLEWAADSLGLRLAVSDNLVLTHPPEASARAAEILAEADDWELAALDSLTNTSKSLLVSLALARGRIDAATACTAARVAEQHQIDEWGEVEAGHDLDAADLAVRIGASSAFMRLLGR
jgi:ATP synthase F1 complex assembly factor 2